jgi:serine protease Do
VTLSNLERVGARLVGWDHWTDLSLLRINLDDARRRGLAFKHAEFGDSDRLYVGQTVYAVGTPHGLTRTVTRGIISNNNRYFEDTEGVDGYETGNFNTWLQTDAAINPGNSGGPLVTDDGRIVGITSRAYLGANNLGFAIPSSTARRVVAGLVRDGSITRSYIGIVPKALQDLEGFYDVATNTGMLVDSVESGSPAAGAGLRAGDIILAIDGKKVDGRFPEQLPPIQNLIAGQPVGSTLVIAYKRGSKEASGTLVTARLESRMGEEWVSDTWGIGLRKVSRAFARENQLRDDTGVLVIGVQRGFPADVAGLARGDIITKINQSPVASLEVVRAVDTAYAAKPAPTLFEVQRERRVSLLVLKP